MLAGRDVHAGHLRSAAQHERFCIRGVDVAAGLAHFCDHRLEMVAARACQGQLPTSHGARHQIGAGLDAIRDDRVLSAAEFGHAVDLDRRRPGSFDASAHLGQQRRKVDDLGLACRVLEQALAVG